MPRGGVDLTAVVKRSSTIGQADSLKHQPASQNMILNIMPLSPANSILLSSMPQVVRLV